MFAVVLDTCVLWPSLQRDVLLSFAAVGLYRPLWSSAVLEELALHEEIKLVGRGVPQEEAHRRAIKLVGRMTAAFDDATVTGWQRLDGVFGLPDPDDEHLVAAAVVGGAGAIVSDNTRDLPRALVPAGIAVLTAAAFARDTVTVSAVDAHTALGQIAARYREPPRQVPDLIDLLERRYGWTEAVALLRDASPAHPRRAEVLWTPSTRPGG